MAEVRSQQRLGIALVVAAAIAWSTATLRVLVGGALVMGAVIADIIGDIRTQRK
jgi:hypothetical protein